MHLQSICIKNFRRLKDVKIELDSKNTIFVGANNSGKTSATTALQLFLGGSRDKFSLYDFSAECWSQINEIGDSLNPEEKKIDLPSIQLDLWFKVDMSDLYYVIDLLPSLDWNNTLVGIRLEFAARSSEELIANYREAKENATIKAQSIDDYIPWPKSLSDYLLKHLNEFELKYYVLDSAHFDENHIQIDDYAPLRIKDSSDRKASSIINSLIRIDFLNAQRLLSDNIVTGRTEDLTKRINRFYERNLQKHENNSEALRALNKSEAELDEHFATVFESTLQSLNELGYPGFNNPHLVVKSSFNAEQILAQTAKVHYSLEDPNNDSDGMTLPDKYNGLGFKNLIYMVIEILDFHARWIDDDTRTPLHLIVIEEPEAHLHSQLQQVFIRQIRKIIEKNKQKDAIFKSQLIVTTHSSHIIYESGFSPIRYFRRTSEKGTKQRSEVLNLSTFYNRTEKDTRDFLQRYMKLTHCDLFFADAAILVEGNVERLLLPQMIDKVADNLKKNYLSILEVGGAFAYRFKDLIEFLGITTLIITDLDSIKETTTESCLTTDENAITSNKTLETWLPKINKISDLLNADISQKIQKSSPESPTLIRVAYQLKTRTLWNGQVEEIAGRTFEEAFALQNLEWSQHEQQKELKLRVINKSNSFTIQEIYKKLFTRIKGDHFKKTDFALSLMMQDPEEWEVPSYIQEGLIWLENNISQLNSTKMVRKQQNDQTN